MDNLEINKNMTLKRNKFKVIYIKDYPLDNRKAGDVIEMTEKQFYDINSIGNFIKLAIENIPQYNNPTLRFCKIRSGTKKPYELDWTNKHYSYDEIAIHRAKEGNFGVICGHGGLAVLDCDDKKLYDESKRLLPKTFEVQTGSGGHHFYFFIPQLKKKIIIQDGGKHYGEIQSNGTQVIAATSIHPNGLPYKVEVNEPIAEIDLATLISCISPFMKKEIEEAVIENKTFFNSNDPFGSINITSIINTSGFKQSYNGELYGSNPWHGSESGMNFWVNPSKNISHCFRCNVGVSVAKAIALNEGLIINCNDSIKGQLFLKLIEVAEQKYGYKKPLMFIPIPENFSIGVRKEKENSSEEEEEEEEEEKKEEIKKPDTAGAVTWDDLMVIDNFVVYEGNESFIYEIHFRNKIIVIEGKELMDYDVFRYKFFQKFGTMLAVGKNFKNFWAGMLTHWKTNYGIVSEDRREELSDIEEAKDIIIDYINDCSIVDKHVAMEGVVTVRDVNIFVSTKIIKKLLRRNNFEKITLRKLAYTLKEYITSGSISLKISKKSERFWRLDESKFDIDLTKKVEITNEDEKELRKE